MGVTARDVLYAIGLLGGLVGLWMAMDRRVTRLEAVNQILKELADRTSSLERTREAASREAGQVGQQIADMARRVLSLEDAVAEGFREVLGRLTHDRRGAGA